MQEAEFVVRNLFFARDARRDAVLDEPAVVRMDRIVQLAVFARTHFARVGVTDELGKTVVHEQQFVAAAHDDALKRAFNDLAHLPFGTSSESRFVEPKHRHHVAALIRAQSHHDNKDPVVVAGKPQPDVGLALRIGAHPCRAVRKEIVVGRTKAMRQYLANVQSLRQPLAERVRTHPKHASVRAHRNLDLTGQLLAGAQLESCRHVGISRIPAVRLLAART